MGNREGSLASRQSTVSDLSIRSRNGCPYRPQSVSRSSTDSEPSSGNNNNCNSGCPMADSFSASSGSGSCANGHKASVRSMACPDLEVLHSAVTSHNKGPMKQRKVSRAASAGRIRTRSSFRNLPGMAAMATRSEYLGDSGKEMVQESWAAVTREAGGSTELGVGIYQRIFTEAPELRGVFHVPEELPLHHLITHTPFHRSAKLFVSVIDLCVRNIAMLEAEMGPVLVMYGRRHYHYLFEYQYQQRDAAFRGIHLPLFAQCIIDYIFATLAPEDQTPDLHAGWQFLLGYITSKIAEGYDLERHRNAANRRKSVL